MIGTSGVIQLDDDVVDAEAAVSAASRCSTVSTETASRMSPVGVLDAAEVRDGRGNLEAPESARWNRIP